MHLQTQEASKSLVQDMVHQEQCSPIVQTLRVQTRVVAACTLVSCLTHKLGLPFYAMTLVVVPRQAATLHEAVPAPDLSTLVPPQWQQLLSWQQSLEE